MQGNRRRGPDGVEVRHAKACGGPNGGRCTCEVSYRGYAWSPRDKKVIRGQWTNPFPLSETHDAINMIRNMDKQVEDWDFRTREQKDHETLVDAGKSLKEKLTVIENELVQVKAMNRQDTLNLPIKLNGKLAALSSAVASADAAPTRQEYELYEYLVAQIDTQLQRLQEILKKPTSELSWSDLYACERLLTRAVPFERLKRIANVIRGEYKDLGCARALQELKRLFGGGGSVPKKTLLLVRITDRRMTC